MSHFKFCPYCLEEFSDSLLEEHEKNCPERKLTSGIVKTNKKGCINKMEKQYELTLENICNFKQNNPELVVMDITKTFNLDKEGEDELRKILLARGVNKWMHCRRELISLKNCLTFKAKILMSQISSLQKQKREAKDKIESFKFHDIQVRKKEELKTIEKMRKSLKKICHSERWVEWPEGRTSPDAKVKVYQRASRKQKPVKPINYKKKLLGLMKWELKKGEYKYLENFLPVIEKTLKEKFTDIKPDIEYIKETVAYSATLKGLFLIQEKPELFLSEFEEIVLQGMTPDLKMEKIPLCA